jgi:CRP/FNR family transcriptional regulator, anaerobic regulatory protein
MSMSMSIASTGPSVRMPTGADTWLTRRFGVSSTAPGVLAELLQALGVGGDETTLDASVRIAQRRVRAGTALLHEGATVASIHVVRSGAFKSVKTSEDGYEQVLSFAGRGDVLGFDAAAGDRHATSAVALEDSTVYTLPVDELPALRRRFPTLDRALQRALGTQLVQAGEVAEMLAAVASEVRLARFLTWLSANLLERGQSPRRLWLRMSRRDIASLLGVAHTTVSRSFTALADMGLVRVDNRDVEILDPDGLRACARITRSPTDRAGHVHAA